MKRFITGAILFAIFASAAFAADSGAVTENTQIWNGRKVFLWDVPVATTASGHLTLYKDSKNIQQIDANGSGRNVTLPAVGDCTGFIFRVINTSSTAVSLTVKNAGASTIGVVAQYQAGDFYCDGATWTCFVYSSVSSGLLPADGSAAGATGQAQDFGTNGIKADVIAESTNATGVTVDGVLLKDAGVTATNIDAGASGTAGSIDIFPTTAAKGKIALAATANTNNDTTTITNAAQGGAYTYTIPDSGGAASFVMTAGTQTIAGVKTFSSSHAGNGITRYIEVSLTNAQMLDLADTPVELIAAPGATTFIEIDSVVFLFDYTAAYVPAGGDDLCINYENEAGMTIATGEATGFVDATADSILIVNRTANVVATKTVSENKAVVLCNEGSDFTGGNAANAVRVKIAYRTWATGF